MFRQVAKMSEVKKDEMKNWNATFISYRREVIRAKNKEEAWAIADDHRHLYEEISTVDEVGVEREAVKRW